MDRVFALRFAVAIVALGELTAGTNQASAQTGSASATMTVSLEVLPNCTVAAGPLAFGSVTAESTGSRSATAAIDVACGPDVPFTVALDGGQNFTKGSRRVLDPASGETVAYDIFVDAGHSRPWGPSGGEAVSATTSSGGRAHLTAYGRIGGTAEIAAGSYGDVVTVTTEF